MKLYEMLNVLTPGTRVIITSFGKYVDSGVTESAVFSHAKLESPILEAKIRNGEYAEPVMLIDIDYVADDEY